MDAMRTFSDSGCGDDNTPDMLNMKNWNSCTTQKCNSNEFGSGTYNVSITCDISDSFTYAAQIFDGYRYIIVEAYTKPTCNQLTDTNALLLNGRCQIYTTAGTVWINARLTGGDDNALRITAYNDSSCTDIDDDYDFDFALTSANLSTTQKSHCISKFYKFYTSDSLKSSSSSASYSNKASSDSSDSSGLNNSSGSGDSSDSSALNALSVSNASTVIDTDSRNGNDTTVLDSDTTSSSFSTGAISGIVVAVIVVVLIVLGFMWRRRQSNKHLTDSDFTPNPNKDKDFDDSYVNCTSPTTGQKSSTDFSGSRGPNSLAGLWDDEVIATARIPRDKVLVQQLINRGGYGEVYYGLFGGQRVAVKMLLPELRKSVKHVNDFLDEVRMMAKLDHPRIVRFVGISWDSLSDLCVVTEYMGGGDLRDLLSTYEVQGHYLGFDRTKITIALHVAHALTYLHSLDPSVLHRDLKSKNILLSSDLEAKVTDFGISRER